MVITDPRHAVAPSYGHLAPTTAPATSAPVRTRPVVAIDERTPAEAVRRIAGLVVTLGLTLALTLAASAIVLVHYAMHAKS
jgi:hypothetical protein